MTLVPHPMSHPGLYPETPVGIVRAAIREADDKDVIEKLIKELADADAKDGDLLKQFIANSIRPLGDTFLRRADPCRALLETPASGRSVAYCHLHAISLHLFAIKAVLAMIQDDVDVREDQKVTNKEAALNKALKDINEAVAYVESLPTRPE